jgi:O-antigen/teichoic acid export membrane protein
MSFLRNVANLLLTQSGTAVVGLASSVILARFLSVEARGELGVLASFALVSILVLQLGWENSTVHAIRARGIDPGWVLLRSLFAGGTAGALLIAVCASGERALVPGLLGEVPRAAFWLAVLGAVPQLMAQYLVGVARGIDAFGRANRYALGTSAGSLAAAALVLIAFDGGLVGLLAAFLAVQLVAASAFAFGLARQTGVARGGARGAELLRFALRTWVVNVLGALHERVDVLLLAALLPDPAPAAFYVVALGLIERLKQIPEAIGVALFPELAARDAQAGARFAARTVRHSLAWLILLAVPIAAAAPWLMPLLYGDPYRASVPVVLVLLPALSALAVYRILSRYFIARGAQGTPIAIQAVSLVANLALNLLLIPRLGAVGAALASLCSYGLAALAIGLAFMRTSGARAGEILLLRRADVDDYRRVLGAR